MRLALKLLALSVSLIGTSPAMSGEQGNQVESWPETQPTATI